MIANFSYNDIISLDNLYKSWREFVRGKKCKNDVALFSINLSANIYRLHLDLKSKTYAHGGYHAFKINDPKPRDIHKASVRDRLLHHAIYRILYPHFDRKFIADSYSCRLNKGTHKALDRFMKLASRASRNHTKTLWVLKCDIRKFFASIDQKILLSVLEKFISDKDILWLLGQVVESFQTSTRIVIPGLTRNPGIIQRNTNLDTGLSSTGSEQVRRYDNTNTKGLPLGNLTSQLLVNIYMNEFDQFAKHRLKARYYIRYADDFVFLSDRKKELEAFLPAVREFLEERLHLELHPHKVLLKTLASGVDFLGWVHFPEHRVLRPATKRRMWRNLVAKLGNESVQQSYLGMLRHGNAHNVTASLSL
jgi:retron-type reverse transcriptase